MTGFDYLNSRITRLSDTIKALPSLREATVTGVAPVTVTYDTDTTGVVVHGSLAHVAVGDRVLTLNLARRVWILGRRGGPHIAAGSAWITPVSAGTPASTTVTFPTGRFAVAPTVVVSPRTNTPGAVFAGSLSPSASGVTIYGVRSTGTTNFLVDWVAYG